MQPMLADGQAVRCAVAEATKMSKERTLRVAVERKRRRRPKRSMTVMPSAVHTVLQVHGFKAIVVRQAKVCHQFCTEHSQTIFENEPKQSHNC